MSSFITHNWQYLSALIGGGVGFWRFLVSRRDDLAWRRTEFLFKQAQYLESDTNMREMLQILGDNHQTIGIGDILSEDSSISDDERFRLRNNLDHLLNFFDRVYYAHATAKTLSKEEVRVFEWYLSEISETEELAQYCRKSGFQDVLKLSKELQDGA